MHEILLALSPLRPLLPDSPYGLQLLFEIQQLVSDGERAGAVLKGRFPYGMPCPSTGLCHCIIAAVADVHGVGETGQLVSVLVQFLLQPQVVDFEDLRSTLTSTCYQRRSFGSSVALSSSHAVSCASKRLYPI